MGQAKASSTQAVLYRQFYTGSSTYLGSSTYIGSSTYMGSSTYIGSSTYMGSSTYIGSSIYVGSSTYMHIGVCPFSRLGVAMFAVVCLYLRWMNELTQYRTVDF